MHLMLTEHNILEEMYLNQAISMCANRNTALYYMNTNRVQVEITVNNSTHK